MIAPDRWPGDWLAACFLASTALTLLTAFLVATGMVERFDKMVFALLHDRAPYRPDGRPKRATTAARDLTALGGDTLRLAFLLGAALLLACDRRWIVAIVLIAIFASARLALLVTKAFVSRPRPQVEGETVVTYTSSFPSGHTFMAGVLFLSAALLIPTGQPIPFVAAAAGLALGASLMIGVTRISLAIHWPSDVAVGWLGAIAWTTGCILSLRALELVG